VPSEPHVLPLQDDLEAGRIERALFCHVHDRWYLGELFCHASWLASLRKAGLACSVCTNASYLELFEHLPGGVELYPAERLDDALLARFDLVVFAATHPPSSYAVQLPRAIYAWNEGLALVRHGRAELELQTPAPNLFDATRHRHGQTALPDGEYLKLCLTSAELVAASSRLDRLPGAAAGPVVVFNPSASNAHTRASGRPKAVENVLSADDCERLVDCLLTELPDHRVLIAAPLKPGDEVNHLALVALGERFAEERRLIAPMNEIDPGDGLSLRAFAALLADDRVRGMLGNSTGSNAHLAAALDVPAVSIERGADDEMRRNWRSLGRGQMGSFRWRNPHPCTAAIALRWDRHGSAQLRCVVRLLIRHMATRESGWAAALGVDPELAQASAHAALDELNAIGESRPGASAGLNGFAELLDAEHRELAYDFRDEAEYFHAIGLSRAATAMNTLTAIGSDGAPSARPLGGVTLGEPERALVAGMLSSSNLLKNLRAAIARGQTGRPVARDG